MLKKKAAIFTVVQDGGEFLKIWYKYYSKYFSPDDIYILNCESKDGVVDKLDCNIKIIKDISVTNVPVFNKIVNDFKTTLFKKYEIVMYSDFDEILYHPKGFEYIFNIPLWTTNPAFPYDSKKKNKNDYFTARGFEIVQSKTSIGPHRAVENTLDFNKPILNQRSYWYRCTAFDKTLILKKDVKWALGNHTIFTHRMREKIISTIPEITMEYKPEMVHLKRNYISDLYLIHLHKVDYEHCYKINEKNIRENKKPIGGGTHNFFLNQEFDKWWKSAERKLIKIPEGIKTSGIF